MCLAYVAVVLSGVRGLLLVANSCLDSSWLARWWDGNDAATIAAAENARSALFRTALARGKYVS